MHPCHLKEPNHWVEPENVIPQSHIFDGEFPGKKPLRSQRDGSAFVIGIKPETQVSPPVKQPREENQPRLQL